ncbi:hypothetical protein ASG98_17290 [Bacillus sp. Soil531]|nr:hypothetical protein ASG98_17290 [Bacillus sp. Soil531]
MNKEALNKLDAAIMIATLTALSYGLAYVYQLSYNLYFHLPSIFIELNIISITKVAVVLFFILFFSWFIFYGAYKQVLNELPVSHEILGYGLAEIKKRVNITLIVIAIVLIVPSVVAAIFGIMSASLKTDYMVIREGKNLFAVISSYKDSAVIAPLDIHKESVAPKFKLIEFKDLKNTEMVKFKDGLKVDEVRSSKELDNIKNLNR